MSDDSELLQRYAVEKSEEAFAELVQRHVDLVYSMALRQVAGDVHLAEDVTQQVFRALALKAAALARRPAISGWLCRSTHFAASDLVRAERRRRAREQKVYAMNSLLDDSSQPADWDKFRPVLDAAVAELGEPDRDAVALRFFDGRSFAEVGAKLRLTENAARMRVERALDKLRRVLAQRGVTSTAAALSVALAGQSSMATPPALVSAVVVSAASASVISGGSGVSLSLMAANSLKITVVGALLVVGGVSLFLQHRAAQLEIAALRAKIAEQEATSKREVKARRDPLAETEIRQPADRAVSIPPPAGSKVSATTAMLKDPEYAAIWRKQKIRQITRACGKELAQLNLPPEQMAKLMDLIFDRTEAERDAREVAQNADMNQAESNRAVSLANDEVYAKIKALLGDDIYGKFQTALQTSRINLAMQNQFGADLAASSVPLSNEQSSAMTEIYATLKVPLNPAFQGPADPATGLTPLDQTLLDQAGHVLTPAQWRPRLRPSPL